MLKALMMLYFSESLLKIFFWQNKIAASANTINYDSQYLIFLSYVLPMISPTFKLKLVCTSCSTEILIARAPEEEDNNTHTWMYTYIET